MSLSLHRNCCCLSISTFILATVQRLPGTCSLCMVPEVNFCLVFHTESETSASPKAFHLSYLSRVDEIICLSSSQRILGVPILLASFNQDVSSLSLHYFFCSHTKPIIELQDKDIRSFCTSQRKHDMLGWMPGMKLPRCLFHFIQDHIVT